MRSKKSFTRPLLVVVGLFVPALVYAATLTVPNTFISGDPILASEVNANFTAVRQAVNANAPILGEVRMFAGTTAPHGWVFCEGQISLISANPELFAVLGSTYGGDGISTFGLPDLRGRAPIGRGQGPGLTNRSLGDEPGAELVILAVTQLPSHDHTLRGTNSSATQTQPAGNVLARTSTPQYLNTSSSVVLNTDSIGASGSNAPHPNMPPSIALNFIIRIQE